MDSDGLIFWLQSQYVMPTVLDTFIVNSVTLSDNVEIAYIDKGIGLPIVFVHGLASNFKVWSQNVSELSKDYRCIALDLPGYGQSSKNEYKVSIRFFAEMLAQFIRALALEEPVLIAHSMGGHISILLAAEQMVPIRQLILTAPAGFEQFSAMERKWFHAVMTPTILKAASIERIKKNIRENFYHFPEEAGFMLTERLQLLKNKTAYDYYTHLVTQSALAMIKEPVYDLLQDIDIPTLILFGEEDQLIPNRILHPQLTTKMIALAGQSQIENSQLIMLPEAGHFLQFEQADSYNEHIRNFVGLVPDRMSAEKYLKVLYSAVVQKDFPKLSSFYADSANLDSTLWGSLDGEHLLYYLEHWMDVTIDILLIEESLQELEENQWSLNWQWHLTDPLTNKEMNILVKSVFTIINGQATYQKDTYSIWEWLTQTHGLNGRLWGWWPWWQAKVKQKAKSMISV